MVPIDFKLADKNESSKAYVVMLGKNLLQDFEVLYIFHKMWF